MRLTRLRALMAAGLMMGAIGSFGCSQDAAGSDEGDDGELQESRGARCDEACALAQFRELAKIARPSNGEAKVRDWLNAKVAQAKQAGTWTDAEVKVDVDAAGNMVVRLPGTGALKAKRPLVIQSHMDMVLAVKDAPPGQPLEPFFANGVDVVEEDGIMHTRDFKTTLGADNGTGVAQMVRYILDRSLAHPPLELVFTTAEEIGLVGATKFDVAKLPLTGNVMINLDGMSVADWSNPDLHQPLAITVGANGGMTANLDGKLQSPALPAGAKIVKVGLDGLLGGHSGLLIHEKRMNAIRAFAAIVEKLAALGAEPRIVDVNVGEVQARKGQNKIPSSFAATIALAPSADVAALTTQIQSFFATYAADYTKEVLANVKLTFAPQATSVASALPADVSKALAHALDSVPNGVVTSNADYPASVEVSSNLGVFGINGAAADRDFFLGYLPRAYVVAKAEAVVDSIHATVKQPLVQGGQETKFEKVPVLPWLVPVTAPQVTIAKAAAGDVLKNVIRMPAGTEPGVFMEKFPQLKDRALGIGAVITEAHTPRESMNVKSFLDATTALQRVIEAFGKDPQLLR